MKTSANSTEKILVSSQFSLFYQRARAVRWTSESSHAYKLLFALRGSLRSVSGETTFDLNEGDALVLTPEETAKARGENAELLALAFAPALVLDTAVDANLTRTEARITFRLKQIQKDEKLLRLAFDLKTELLEDEAGQEVVTRAVISQMLVHLLRRYANIRRSDELELSRAGLVDRRIRRAVELMHTHLARELPLDEIAAAAYLSPFHFARLFKKLMGTSPHAYLARLRQTEAQRLLAETDLSVTDIAARVGYGSSSHFTKAFRHATNMTPRAFRQALVRPRREIDQGAESVKRSVT